MALPRVTPLAIGYFSIFPILLFYFDIGDHPRVKYRPENLKCLLSLSFVFSFAYSFDFIQQNSPFPCTHTFLFLLVRTLGLVLSDNFIVIMSCIPYYKG